MKPSTHARSFLALIGSSLLTISFASATDYWWDSTSPGTAGGFGNTTGTWGTSTFWGTNSAGTSATANTTITSVDTVNFGTATLNYNNGTIGVAAGGVTVGSIVIGAGQTTAINLGTAGNTVTIHSGITKNAGSGNFIFVSPVTLAASQTWTNNSPAATVTAEAESLRASAGINYGANTFTIDGIGVTGFSGGAITGSGDFIKNGSGTVVFNAGSQNNSATFTGKIILNGGVARYQDTNNLSSGNIQISGGVLEGRFGTASNLTRVQGTAANQIQITGGVSGFSGQGATASTFNIGNVTWGSTTFNPSEFVLQSATTNLTGVGIFSSAIDLNGANRTIRSDQTGGNLAGSGTFSGVISNSTGTAGLIKTGIGHHILSANNTYNGNTTVNQGTLTATTTSALPGFNVAGRVTVADGATLNVRTGAWTSANIDSLRTNATWSASGSQLGLDTTAGAFTYASNITQALTLIKIGNNNLTLTGANTYTGKTFLTGGSVFVPSFGNVGDASSPLGTNSTIEFFTGGNLSFTGTTVQSSNKTFNIAQGDATLRADGTGVGAITLTANINPTSTSNKTLQLFGANTNANTISGNISNGAGGVLSLNKGLAGTWVLSGNNSYTGATTISGGTLVAAGATALPSASQIVWNTTGTTLRLQQDSNFTLANTLNWATPGITRTLVADRVTSGAATNITISAIPNIGTSTTFNYQSGSNVTSGTPTITYSNGITNTDSASATSTSQANVISATGVNVVINGITSSARTRFYTFQGDSHGNQVTGTFANGTGTTVNKTGTGTWTFAGTSQYTGTTTINAGTLVFARQTSLYNNTASSWIAANINVQNTGTLAFNVGGTSEFTTGNVTTLLTNLAASSGGTNGMNAGSRFGFDTTNASGGSFTIGDIIADSTGAGGGNRGLTKLGTNTLVLSNSNTYTGATTVSEGKLLVNGSTAAGSTVGVAAGATLGGTGTIGGTVNVTGSLSPGASIQTLGTGTLSFAASSTLIHELDSSVAASVGSDLVKVTGDLNLTGTVGLSLADIALTDVAFTVGDIFSLINYTGTWNNGLFTLGGNELADEEVFTFGLNTWRISYNDATGGLNYIGEYAGGSDSFVNLHVIPEPRAALLGSLGLLMLFRRRR